MFARYEYCVFVVFWDNFCCVPRQKYMLLLIILKKGWIDFALKVCSDILMSFLKPWSPILFCLFV